MFDYFMDVEYVVCGELHCWGTPCIREVCIIEMSTFKIWTYHVKICSKVEDMSEKDKRTALYVKKNINGLNPYIWSSYTCFRLIDEFKTYFERNKNFRIAYKGGIYEKKLIEHFGCNSLDVEKYPFCVPPIKNMSNYNSFERFGCGEHSRIQKSNMLHCPKAECCAFIHHMYMNSLDLIPKDIQQTIYDNLICKIVKT